MSQFHHSSMQSPYYNKYEPTSTLLTQLSMYPPPLDPSQRRTGRVKFFNAVKGYGFIIPNATHHIMNEEVFVHHTSIISSNKGLPVELNKGEEVEYDLRDGPKGIYALYVTGPKGLPFDNYYSHSTCAANIQQHSKSVYPPPCHQHQQYVTYFIPSPLYSYPPVPPPPSTTTQKNGNLISYY